MEKKKVLINGKEVPLTKSGLPNKNYLTKKEKEELEKIIKERKNGGDSQL